MPSLPNSRKNKKPRSKAQYKKDGSVNMNARVPFHGWEPEYASLYHTMRWEKIRKTVLQRDPTCPICMHRNQLTAACEVDHVVAHKGDASLFHSLDNLWALCTPCHRQKTACETNGDDFTSKKEWLERLLLLDS